MKIRKSKEALVLTQKEKIILSEALAILEDIFDESEAGGSIENFADRAKDSIEDLLEYAEVEGGEPTGVINISIKM